MTDRPTLARVAQAAYNNAVWCDTICRTHSAPGEFRPSIWLSRRATPRFYPNAVTLADPHDQAAQLAGIRELLAAGIPGAWAVKDSFCTLDLTPLGFRLLFEATWIERPARSPRPEHDSTGAQWRNVRDPDELQAWEAAWSGTTDHTVPAPARIFLPALLADPNVVLLAAYREQQIVAGAIANRSDEVVGLSNVFVPDQGAPAYWGEAVGVLIDMFPGLSIVGYEAGAELALAQSLGFEALHPLRVWETATAG
jgi:hypothetical protein